MLVITVPPAEAPLHLGGLYGGTVTVAVLADVNMEPRNASDSDLEAIGLAFDALARRSAIDQTPVPWLAQNWSVTSTQAVFTLRPGAQWADRSPVTTSDVAHSFQQYNKSGVSVSAGSGTVTFTFTANAGRFFGEWIYLPIAWRSGNATVDPRGNGPYLIQDRVAGDHLTLVANPGHWNGRPYLDAVTYRLFASVEDAACGLIRGDATLIGFPLIPVDLSAIRPCPNIPGDPTPADPFNTSLADLNLTHLATVRNPGLTQMYLGMNTARPPLDDPDLRRGIVQTLDKDLALSFEGSANSEIAESLLVAGNFHWYNASVPKYRVDKVVVGSTTVANFDRVNNELDRAGFIDRNSDGWREDKNGNPFELRFLIPSVSTDIKKFTIALQTETNLGKIGVRTNTFPLSWAEIAADVNADNFDIALALETVGKDPDFYFDLFHQNGARNLVNLNDAAMNAAVLATRNEIEAAVRQQLARDMQGLVAESLPWAPVLHYKTIDVYDKSTFTGWVHTVGGVNNFWTFISLHVFPQGGLRVALTLSTNRLEVGEQATVIVVVTGDDDLPVPGVEVEFTGGAFSPTIVVTDSSGYNTTSFTAGTVTATTDVALTATAVLRGYEGGSATTTVTVAPVRRNLRVTFERPSAQLESNEVSTLRVLVADASTLANLPGATVTLSVSPANFGASLDPMTGTTGADGSLSVAFSADVSVQTYFQITAQVTLPGYAEANPPRTTIFVEAHAGSFGGAPDTPGPDALTLMLLVAALGIGYTRLQGRRRKKT